MSERLRFGAFAPPYHPLDSNPTLSLKRDLKLVGHLEEFGFDEIWFGEHHSSGWEIIPSPELMIAAAAARTERIRLGTGVVSLPYHHPFMVAQRMTFLDHLTEGRTIFGVGSGGLPSDAAMLGLDAELGRRRYEDALQSVLKLIRSQGAVDHKTDWYELVEARVHLPPYSDPHMEIAVASTSSPTGPTLSGRYGVSMLSLGQWTPSGAESLRTSWGLAQAEADRCGNMINRDDWRIVGISFVANTDAEARRQCKDNLGRVFEYLTKTAPFPPVKATDPDDIIDELNDSGVAMIGTPSRAIDRLEALVADTGGFGTYLVMNGDWAGYRDMVKMYEVFAEKVMPHFQNQLGALRASFDYVSRPSEDDANLSWTKAKLIDAKAKTANLHGPASQQA